MKGLKFENGQPMFIAEDMNYLVDSLESAIKERMYELIYPGVVPNSAFNGEDIPFKLTIQDTVGYPFKVTLGTGIAYSLNYNGEYLVPSLSYSENNLNYGAERFVNSQPKIFNLPPVLQTTTYFIYLAYKPDINYNKPRVSKLDNSVVIYPYKVDNFEIKYFTNPNDQNILPYYIYIGHIIYYFENEQLITVSIHQSGMKYLKLRYGHENSFRIHDSNSHSNGILGEQTLELSLTSDKKIRLRQFREPTSNDPGFYAVINGKHFYNIAEFTTQEATGLFVYYTPGLTGFSGTKNLYLKAIQNECKIELTDNIVNDRNYLRIGVVNFSNGIPFEIIPDNTCYGSIGNKDLKNNSVTESKIANNSITNSKISNNSVTVNKILIDNDLNFNNNKILNVSRLGVNLINPTESIETTGNIKTHQDLILLEDKKINVLDSNSQPKAFIKYNSQKNRWVLSEDGATEKYILGEYLGLKWIGIEKTIGWIIGTQTGTRASRELFVFPPGTIIHGIKVKHLVRFQNGNEIFISIGSNINDTEYTYPFLISSNASGDNYQYTNIIKAASETEFLSVYSIITTNGLVQNIAPSDGIIRFWFLVSRPIEITEG